MKRSRSAWSGQRAVPRPRSTSHEGWRPGSGGAAAHDGAPLPQEWRKEAWLGAAADRSACGAGTCRDPAFPIPGLHCGGRCAACARGARSYRAAAGILIGAGIAAKSCAVGGRSKGRGPAPLSRLPAAAGECMSAVLAKLNLVAQRAAQRSDIVIALFTVLAVIMMIIPLPTTLVDALIGINIGFSLLILVVAFYISHPVEYSSLPPIILLATLFRLALSITTTRLILLEGDAGQIVSAFGHFVIAGEVVIGLVVFLIITVAQFLVITKGAERVAEVAARFILDAMPGKQMSIDNDLRNGDIDQEEARGRRRRLEQESQLYGALDGAMKFVKGDAIAGLVILCVNLIGGLSLGMVKRGMSFGEAVNTYSLLSVGDGLVAQIPALLIAVGAGTVVTRVSSNTGHSGDLGSEIVGQLGRNSRALGLTAVILFFVAFIPGFASGVFLALAAGLGFAAFVIRRRERRLVAQADGSVSPAMAMPAGSAAASPPEAPPSPAPHEPEAPTPGADEGHRVRFSLAASLAEELSQDALRWELDAARRRAGETLGV